jgi:hypothetical protein
MTLIRDSGAPSEVKLIIYHQYDGIELISPAYAGRGATCHLLPNQKVDVGSTAQAGFNIEPDPVLSIGALMYKLRRKDTDQTDEETTYIQLFVVWKTYNFRRPHVYSFLMEHDEDRVWDGDELAKLAGWHAVYYMQHNHIEDTWLIYDNRVLMKKVHVTREEKCYKLEITITEGSINKDTRRPEYFDMGR